MQIRFKHLVEDTDRHGNIRVYVRLPGRQKVRIRAPFGTDEFIAAYNAAVSEHVSAPPQARAAKAGSFRHVCVLYYASPTFKRLDAATQSWRRRALDSMCEKHADKPVARMEARHVRALRDERFDQPGAANTRLKALKALFAWLCEEKPELVRTNLAMCECSASSLTCHARSLSARVIVIVRPATRSASTLARRFTRLP
jgi:integrase/recombinase XerD